MGNIKGITIEIGGNTTKLSQALSNVNKESSALQKELKEVDKLLKLDPTNTELLTQKQNLLKNAIASTKDKLNTLKEAEKQVQEQFKNGEVSEQQYRSLQRQIVATEQSLNSLYKATSNSSVALEKIGAGADKLSDKASNLSNKLKPVSTAAIAAGTASLLGASNFEDAIAKVSTIADASVVSITDMSTAIMKLSNDTGQSATDIAEAVYNAISGGVNTADAVTFVANATKLAKAGFTDTANATDILTTALNAYGLSAENVTSISDMLITTQNLGKTTVNELASAMGKVIPTANANNLQIDQLCTAYADMTAKGIATAESTTYLNSMFNELGKGGTTVDSILREKTGKSFSELNADGAILTDSLQILKDSANETGKSFGDLWSSSEAGKAATVLLGNSTEEFTDILGQMRARHIPGGHRGAQQDQSRGHHSDKQAEEYSLDKGIAAEGHALDVVLQSHKGVGVGQGKGLRVDGGVCLEGVDQHDQDGQHVDDADHGEYHCQRHLAAILPGFQTFFHHCCTSFLRVERSWIKPMAATRMKNRTALACAVPRLLPLEE